MSTKGLWCRSLTSKNKCKNTGFDEWMNHDELKSCKKEYYAHNK